MVLIPPGYDWHSYGIHGWIHGPCTDSIFPFETSIDNGLSIAMLNNQRVKQPFFKILLNYCNPIGIHHGNPIWLWSMLWRIIMLYSVTIVLVWLLYTIQYIWMIIHDGNPHEAKLWQLSMRRWMACTIPRIFGTSTIRTLQEGEGFARGREVLIDEAES